MTAGEDAFAPPTATFPLHDVTDVFCARRDQPNLSALADRLPRQTQPPGRLDAHPDEEWRSPVARNEKEKRGRRPSRKMGSD